MDTNNRPDEWKIEQGLSGAQLPILDQTGTHPVTIQPKKPAVIKEDRNYEEAAKEVGDRDKLFVRERDGWKGHVIPALVMVVCII